MDTTILRFALRAVGIGAMAGLALWFLAGVYIIATRLGLL